MRIRLAYGRKGLWIELDDTWPVTIVEPHYIPGLADPSLALTAALRQPISMPPLRELVRPGHRIGIVFSDITRPAPNRLILPVLLAELSHVPRTHITLFNALGTHRRNSEAELRAMLGDDPVDGYRIVQNDAFVTETQVFLGTTSRGHPIWINREIAACDVKILTGFIEPHFFAGFSGGGKAIMPGMAGQATVLGNHDAGMIADRHATWGVTRGNPIWEEITEVAQTVGGAFLVNVTLNREREMTAVFAGDLEAAHGAGCAFARKAAMVPVDEPFDVVLTTNSGYPLDLNLYQTVKGMSAAAQVVREGGAILAAADCWDGIPDHGLYGKLLRAARNPKHLLETITAPGFLKQDQWQAQIQAQIQIKADVHVYSDNLTDEQIRGALLKPCRGIEAMIGKQLAEKGPRATLCVLPDGPQTIPYIETKSKIGDV